MKLTIATLNIEGDKHIPKLERFIETTKSDILCLQEVFRSDYELLTKNYKLYGKFTPTVYIDVPGKPGFRTRGVFGVAILSKMPGAFGGAYYFKRRQKQLPRYRGYPNAGHRTLVWQRVANGPVVATTHFTWSKGGKATEKQRDELNKLITLLDTTNPDILLGDFNAPRGGEIWSELSKRFIDHIPPEIRSTIDPILHYTKGLQIVVDGVFTNPGSHVRVTSVKLVSGLSDHQAIVVTVTTTPTLASPHLRSGTSLPEASP